MRVFAAFLCLLSLFSFSGISARGVNTKEYKQQATFWTMFSGVPILKEFLGYTAGLVCPESDDGYHHASSYEVDRESGYYNCICDVCGWPFLAYETDLQQAYETQVSELPATGVTSSGGLIWRPRWSDFNEKSDFSATSFLLKTRDTAYSIPNDFSSYISDIRTFKRIDDYTMLISWGNSTGASMFSFNLNYLKAPVSGYYSSVPDFVYSSIEYFFGSVEVSNLSNSSSFIPLVYCNSGESLRVNHYSPGFLKGLLSSTSSHRNYLYTFLQ